MRALWLLLALSACAHTKNYGAGDCREYVPMCILGQPICETTDRGCQVCTCENGERTGEEHPSYIPDPRQQP
jgi:hypothetical protein